MKIVNVFQPFNIFAKRSVLDVWQSSEYFSDYDYLCYVDKRFKDGKDVLSLLCSNSDIWLTPETRLHHDLLQTNTKRLLTLLKGTNVTKRNAIGDAWVKFNTWLLKKQMKCWWLMPGWDRSIVFIFFLVFSI